MTSIANTPNDEVVELPSVEDTIAAMAVLGRIIDELRARLVVSERMVATMQSEKRTLQVELHSLVEYAARRAPCAPTVHIPERRANASLDASLAALVKGIDASFGRLHH